MTSGTSVQTAELSVPSPWFSRKRPFGIFLVVTAAIGLIASFDLSIEKIKKLENPGHVLSCDFNPFFSCGSVMNFWQAQVFGFPNQLIGIAAFIFPLLLGVLLISRTEIPRWVMIGLLIGLTGGVALVIFLFISSIFVIGIGCPWCIVVWTVVIPMWFITAGHLALTGGFGSAVQHSPVVQVFASHAVLLSALALALIYLSIVAKFWTFFSSLV